MARILIVDDEAVNRLLISTVLTHDGHEVSEAIDEETALSSLRNAAPDLMILDLNLAGNSGVDVVRSLRRDATMSGTNVALYTSTHVDDAMRDFMQMWNIRHLIPKPGEPHEILAAVHDALKER
jgi:CheY-like chemotaxis protein